VLFGHQNSSATSLLRLRRILYRQELTFSARVSLKSGFIFQSDRFAAGLHGQALLIHWSQ
jgi:predicted RNA binding protein with dsRBD fold (UPF0201 family)